MFYTPPSRFAPPTYPRKKPPLAGSPPEQAPAQSQPEPAARVPYRPTEEASPRPPGNTTPLIFRALAHPSLRQPRAAAAAYSDSIPALQSQTQPASAPAPSQSPAQPQQPPPTASTATQSTEEDPKAAPAFQEAAAHVEAESTLRDQPPTATAAPGQQLSSKPTDATPQSPSPPPSTPAPAQSPAQPQQTPSTASPAPQSTEEDPKVAATLKEAPAPPQPPAPPPAAAPAPQSTKYAPKVEEALKQARAQVEADTAREKRDTQLAELEATGMADHAKTLRSLDAEMAQRRADLEMKHPQHDAQYEAGMRELEKEKEARQAPVMEKIQAFKKKERVDNLRAAKIVVSRESKLPQTRGKTEEQKQAEWKAQMARAGLDPNNHEHVSAYWDAKNLHYLNDGHYAKYDWDGSPPKREGFGSAVLSDGSLHVAPEFIHNDKKYAAVVAASGASEAEKARAMAELPHLQQGYAEAMLPILKQAGSTRAAELIPGIASFQKWQSEKPRQGSEAEQANEYLKEMNQRGVWSKGTDNVLRSLLAGFADMGTMAAGMAGMVGVPGASETAAEWSKRSSDFMAPISAEGGNSGTTSAILGHVARMAGPMAASLLLTRGLGGGIKTMSALSGAQTAGSQYAETYGQLREEGKTHGQAWLATAPFALASGLATAFLTAAGGATGFEAALSTKAGTQTAKDAAQGFWKNLLLNVPKHALADIPQELPDELFSQMMSALATNHNADLGKVAADFIKNSPQLIGAIVLMGGAGGAVQTQQQFKNGTGQTQMEESGHENPVDETKQPPTAEPSIPDTTTDASPASEKPSKALPGKPSRPPLDVKTSKDLITNVEKIQKHRPLNPVEQADLDQARRVVAEDEQQRQAGAAQNAQPSTPPLSVEQSQKLIHNVMNRPPEQRGHPTTQADLAQSRKVVQDHVQRLESQTTPLSDAQKKELADAKAALARTEQSLPNQQHVSGNTPTAEVNAPAPRFQEKNPELLEQHRKKLESKRNAPRNAQSEAALLHVPDERARNAKAASDTLHRHNEAGALVKTGEMGGKHINEANILEAPDGNAALHKPDDGQSEKKIRAGVEPGTTGHREVAASKIAQALGIDLVPPTTMLTHDGRPGSAQVFKKGMINGKDASDPNEGHNIKIDSDTELPEGLPPDTAHDWQLTDDLLMHSDRHRKNYMLRVENGKIVEAALVDNGHSLPANTGVVEKRYPGPLEGQPISPLNEARLHRMLDNEESLRQSLKEHLEPEAIDGLFARAKALLARGTYGNFTLDEINAHLPTDKQRSRPAAYNDRNQ